MRQHVSLQFRDAFFARMRSGMATSCVSAIDDDALYFARMRSGMGRSEN
jgi:hypothetical protein